MAYVRSLSIGLLALCARFVAGCCGPVCQVTKVNELFAGGGVDAIVIDMPFASGYESLCTQGTESVPTHSARSTKFDVDLDTPNTRDDAVFAPVGGVAYIHDDSDDEHGFGLHINIDQGDGTYVLIAHLDAAFIDNESEVAPGQLLGFEGETGYAFGDHVHLGRHAGDASLDALYGESFDGLIINMEDAGTGDHVQLMTSEMWCDLPDGAVYRSLLPVPLWHPQGSLITAPDDSTIYQVDVDGIAPFMTEESFLTRNFDYADVTLVSAEELACYGVTSEIVGASEIKAVYGNGADAGVWLLIGTLADAERFRLKVPTLGWQAVLKSWGIVAATYDDLVDDTDLGGIVTSYPYTGTATFRDGSLVSPVGESDVYVMSRGIAMPIDHWNTLLFAGWEDRSVIEIGDNEFDAVVAVKGDCSVNIHCLSALDMQTCGGPDLSTEGIVESAPVTNADELTLTWYTPGNEIVDAVVMTGEVTRDGIAAGWGSVFGEQLNTNSVTVSIPDLDPGDTVRFSVEYLNDDDRSWSCLAPYPPGTVQGSVIADYMGSFLPYTTADDPGSDGCGLIVTVE